ncbi:MAG: 2-oxo acid dehydrogenase subunit E2, partial [Caldilineae bacterium]
MAEFRMPSLGADMQSGTLVEWLKKPGDPVHHGDIIAIVGTEKGDIEVEVFEDGVLSEILVQEGQEVPVGTVLALIRGEGETEAPTKTEAPAQAPQPVAAAAEAGSPAVHGPPQPMPS